jgi:adenine phosphoribosyltransferase
MVSTMTTSELIDVIRSVPDFPKKGIVFRDITTLLKDPVAFRTVVDLFYDQYKESRIDKVVSVESRGFIFAGPLAYRLRAGFIPIRKPGKLPAETVKQDYTLEYGTDSIEVHRDAINRGERVLIHDDLLATGGTIAAASELVKKLGGEIVGLAFLIELSFLRGRERLGNMPVFSILRYDRE